MEKQWTNFSDHTIGLYILIETIRASCSFYLFNDTSEFGPSVLIFIISYLAKVSIATTCLFVFRGKESEKLDFRNFRHILRHASPSAFEFLAMIVYTMTVPVVSSLLLQGLIAIQVAASAVFYHFQIQKQHNVFFWSSLMWLVLGLLGSSIPFLAANLTEWTIAVAASYMIGILSAASSVSREKLLKAGSLWGCQIWIYMWATSFSVLSYPARELLSVWTWWVAPTFHDSGAQTDFWAWLGISGVLVSSMAVAAIIDSVILRRKSNLAQIFGTSTSFLTTRVVLAYASTTFLQTAITWWSIPWYIATTFSAWNFDRHIRLQKQHSYISLRPDDCQLLALSPSEYSGDENDANDEISGIDSAIHTEQGDQVSAAPAKNQESSNDSATDREFATCLEPGVSFETLLDATSFGMLSKLRHASFHGFLANIAALLWFFCPSFIPLRGQKDRHLDRKLHPTAYLDGLRGVAAFFVFLFHIACIYSQRTLSGWNGTTQTLFVQLPWIRLLLSGQSMVAIFFVVSGFSISYSPLKRIRSQDHEGFTRSLASSVTRRHLRLFLPCAAISFIDMLVVYFGIDSGGFSIPRLPILKQAQDWFKDFLLMANPVRGNNTANWQHIGSKYAGHTWTIPVEFRGSMVVYVLLFGCARMRPKIRVGLVTILGVFWGYYLSWDLMLFLSGMAMAELHLMREELAHFSGSLEGFRERSTALGTNKQAAFLWNLFWLLNFLLATYILSFPSSIYPPDDGDPGYKFIWSLTLTNYVQPEFWSRFWPAIGSMYLVFTIDRLKLIQCLFTNRLVQYLGFISFALYLVHLPLMIAFGQKLVEKSWLVTGKDTMVAYCGGFFGAFVIILVSLFVLSDIFTRAVDHNSIRLSKWVYDKLVGKK